MRDNEAREQLVDLRREVYAATEALEERINARMDVFTQELWDRLKAEIDQVRVDMARSIQALSAPARDAHESSTLLGMVSEDLAQLQASVEDVGRRTEGLEASLARTVARLAGALRAEEIFPDVARPPSMSERRERVV